MLAGLILIATLLLTVLVGTPFALAMARPASFRHRAARTADATRSSYSRVAFVPLDLGEDKIKWPSEMAPRTAPRAVPPWPSELWNDEYFGQNRKKLPELTGPTAKKAAPAKAKKKTAKKAKPQVQKKKAQKKKVQPSAEDAFFTQNTKPQPQGAPNRQEIEALVGRLGLAGAVQEIMNRTGWDFRQAAHYLAKSRQK